MLTWFACGLRRPPERRPGRLRLCQRALVLLMAALPPSPAAAQAGTLLPVNDPGWRLQSSGGGVDLYGASIRDSGVVPLKATLTIPGTIEEVSLVLEDMGRREQWIGNRTESHLLERKNDYDRSEYVHVDLPWPVSDRTALLHAWVTVSDDGKCATITGESVESPQADKLPRQVRARIHTSTFQMTQLPGRVNIVVLAFVDPGGWMPKWLVSRFTSHVARSTFVGLRQQVARKLYSARQVAAMRQRILAYGSVSGEEKRVKQAHESIPSRPEVTPSRVPVR